MFHAIVTSLTEPVSVVDKRRLKAAIANHLREGRLVHVVDLTEVENVGTRLMQVLLALFHAVQRANRVFALVITRTAVLESFAVTGLDGILPIFGDVAQAVRAAEACAENPDFCLRTRAKVPA